MLVMKMCPKCGASMSGPRWESHTDRLVYRCACGYKKRTPTHDSEETKAAILRQVVTPNADTSRKGEG